MTYEQIFEMWKKDGDINVADITSASANIPKLHNIYFRIYVEEGLKLKRMKAEFKKLNKLKIEYYKGQLDDEELKQYGWKPQPLRILNQDVPTYVESDDDIIHQSLKIGLQESVVEYLESILRQINNRGFQLKAIIDWEKFRSGVI